MLTPLLAAVAFANLFPQDTPSFTPTVNLEAVRQIDCNGDEGASMGSGYVVAKDVIISVLHVATGGKGGECWDHKTGNRLKPYVIDTVHDFTIFSGRVPLVGPYIKYSCEPFHKGEDYIAFGWSNAGYDTPAMSIKQWYNSSFLRMYDLQGTGVLTDKTFMVGDIGDQDSEPGLSKLEGRTAPGTSGGPIVDLHGYVHGGVNVGYSVFGIPQSPTFSYALHDTKLCNS